MGLRFVRCAKDALGKGALLWVFFQSCWLYGEITVRSGQITVLVDPSGDGQRGAKPESVELFKHSYIYLFLSAFYLQCHPVLGGCSYSCGLGISLLLSGSWLRKYGDSRKSIGNIAAEGPCAGQNPST